MTSSVLKILACLFMLIDHTGAVLFPKVIIFRIIGRLAFPIFAYLIAEGYRKTKDITKYLGRLILFALASQIPFNLAFSIKGTIYLNVFFTLAMGLFALYLYDKEKNFLQVLAVAFVCYFVNTDYGAFGVLLIFVFNKYHEDFKKMALSAVGLTIIFQSLSAYMAALNYSGYDLTYRLIFALVIQPLSLLALIFIKFYNKEKGWDLKYLFYTFYPLHLILLWLIKGM